MSGELDRTPKVGMIEGAKARQQSVTSDWTVLQSLIEGVIKKEIRSVVKNNGRLTEIYRSDWGLDGSSVDQVFQMTLNPGEVEAWHVHGETTDRFFVSSGRLKLVLYDSRENSPTHGMVNEFLFGIERPAIVSVPPGVWHGIKNIGDGSALVLNLVDKAYVYEEPDHWGLPADTDKIPYSFA